MVLRSGHPTLRDFVTPFLRPETRNTEFSLLGAVACLEAFGNA